jgi:manganese transport protein
MKLNFFGRHSPRMEAVEILRYIGPGFIVTVGFVDPGKWTSTLKGLFIPSFPEGALPIIMSVLGAVVMPHNLFLHSEIIQSRQWNLETEKS